MALEHERVMSLVIFTHSFLERSLMRATLLLLVLMAGFRAVDLQAQTACRTADTASTSGLASIREVVHSTRSETAAFRTILHVDATADSQVTVMTVDSLCVHAMQVRGTDEGRSFASHPVHVYKVGTQYWVDDPKPGSRRIMYVLSSSFAIVERTGL
jgi:hypothetical protein